MYTLTLYTLSFVKLYPIKKISPVSRILSYSKLWQTTLRHRDGNKSEWAEESIIKLILGAGNRHYHTKKKNVRDLSYRIEISLLQYDSSLPFLLKGKPWSICILLE